MPPLRIFDPPLCCSTGVCGVEVDEDLVRFAADVKALTTQGHAIERYNLGHQPEVIYEYPALMALLAEKGLAALPAVLSGEALVHHGSYPPREAMLAWLSPVSTEPTRIAS